MYSNYQGDILKNSIMHIYFDTLNTSDVPTTLVGGVLNVYEDDSLTQTTNGLTLAVDRDGQTGFNLATIDTSDSFYNTGSNYVVMFDAGTVNSVSVKGRVIGTFSILNRTTAAIKVATDATLTDTTNLIDTFIKASGQINSATANSAVLAGSPSSENNFYKWDIITLTDGQTSSGGQSRLIISYDGSTSTVTVFPDWEITPPTPNGGAALYKIIPGGLRSLYSLDGISQSEISALLPTVQNSNIVQVDGLTSADGVSFNDSFQLMNAIVNGRFKIDDPDPGKITFFKRDNLTVLTIVEVSKTERIRNT